MKTYLKFFFVFLLFSLLFSAVEFIEFNAKTSDMSVELSWSTATETENLGFIIERKTDSLSTWIPLVSYLNEEALQGQGTVSLKLIIHIGYDCCNWNILLQTLRSEPWQYYWLIG